MKIDFGILPVSDLKNGYTHDARAYACLFCSAHYEDGDIYTFGNRLVSAEKAVTLHIAEKHGSVFESLLSADKAQTGLTDAQREFLGQYYSGIPDKEIAEKLNISASTVRFQRYNFREKAKQARMILALAELLEEKVGTPKPVKTHDTGLDVFFESLSPPVLKKFDMKEKNKLTILQIIIKQFERGRKYTEKEVNALLKPVYHDYVSVRRALIDYKLMARTGNGSEYWVI